MQMTAAGAEVRGRDGMGTHSYSCQEKPLQKSRGTMGFQPLGRFPASGDFLGKDRVAQERRESFLPPLKTQFGSMGQTLLLSPTQPSGVFL